MRTITSKTAGVVLAALAWGCGDDGATGGAGGAGGAGGDGTTTTSVTTTTVTTSSTGAGGDDAAGGSGGAPGTGAGGTGGAGGDGAGGHGGEAPACAPIAAIDLVLGGALDLTGAVEPSLGDPDLPDRILVGHGDAAGEHDLTAGFNDGYATCEQCVVVLEDQQEDGSAARVYFQSAGTMTVEESDAGFPYATVALAGVELVEVTLDASGVSTPVEGGGCLALDDVESGFDLPAAWTCNPGYYAAADGCDCGCGAVDPDCADPAQQVYNCGPPHLPANGPTCGGDATCQPPASWSCDAAAFDDGAVCDCDCGGSDLDCAMPGAPVTGCDVGEQCFSGLCATPSGNDTCAAALPLVEGTVAGTWEGAANDYTPASSNDASCTGYTANGPDVVYAVSLTAGQTLAVTLSSASGDESLYLITDCDDEEGTCVAGADASPSAPETIEHTAAADGAFFLVVDQYGAGQGVPFALTVSITP